MNRIRSYVSLKIWLIRHRRELKVMKRQIDEAFRKELK